MARKFYSAGRLHLDHICGHTEMHELSGGKYTVTDAVEDLESLPCSECVMLLAELQAEAADQAVEEVATEAAISQAEMELAEDRVILARRDARSAYNHFDKMNKPELVGSIRHEESYQAWQRAEADVNAATEDRNRLAARLDQPYQSDPARRQARNRWDREYRTEAYEEMELLSAGR